MTEGQSKASLDVYQLPTGRPAPYWGSANQATLTAATQHLQRCFDELLISDERMAGFIIKMQQIDIQGVVFGGWARDRLIEMLRGHHCPSRDVDMVAHGPVSIEQALPSSAVRNPFGGIRVEASHMHFDAWDLPNTFLIRRHRLPVSFEQLPFTADYNVNAIVFKPAQFFGCASLLDAGAIHSVQTGMLDFAADEVAQPLVQAARSIILAVRLHLAISDTVRTFLRSTCYTEKLRQVVLGSIRTYCPTEWEVAAVSLFASIVEGDQ
jgi:hypothetical protein